MSGSHQRRDLSNCGAGRLCVANDFGILSVKEPAYQVTSEPWESSSGHIATSTTPSLPHYA